ncbi:MAG: hypothetical protein ABJP79_01370 [Tateyamaria sp.]|uniref:hypothetical protein n=1 Tax=Tateyamaria sp. TaxID=1929288 RepID=UPI00329F01EB
MIRQFLISGSILLLGTLPAVACIFPHYSPAELRQQNRDARAASKPVVTGADCSFVNAGLNDGLSGGPAIRLENSRIYHVLGTSKGVVSDVMVVDCEGRSATRVRPDFIQNDNYALDSCGGEHGDRYPLLAPEGPLSLTEGSNLAAFEGIAKKTGKVRVDGEMPAYFADFLDKPLPRKDRVDFLCGCRRYHPQSAGGNS